MNNTRRKEIARIRTELEKHIDSISDLVAELESVRDEEQECFDNMPESFQYGEKGERAQAAIDALEEALSSIDSDEMRSALDSLDTASE